MADKELATVLDRPARAAPVDDQRTMPLPPPVPASQRSLATTANTMAHVEALAISEIRRTKTFAIMCLVIALFMGAALAIAPSQSPMTPMMLVGIALACIAVAYLAYRASRPETFHDGPLVSVAWCVPALTVASAVPYAGPFSPVPALAILGIYIIGMSQRTATAAAIYAISAIAEGVTGAVVIAGVADPGIIKSDYLSTEVQIIFEVFVQILLAASFITALASRRASLAAFADLERAVRAVAQREALLDEARDELKRALGTGRGRFTDQTIGEYRLGELIGRGAMGEVYEGVHAKTGEPVAIKMLSLTSLGNTHHVQRFLRELKTAATLDSPNVVRVLAVGEEPLPHLVMERLRGRDLSTILRESRGLPQEALVDLLRQVGAGLTAARAAGIIHRDIKPQNLFLTDATWKILDFGVSRIAQDSDTLTSGNIVGTPSYMAPEQAMGGEIDFRADLYALAAVAYRVLTNHAPFGGGEIVDVLYRVVHTSPRRPSSLAKLHEDVDLALAIGLAKRPQDRFAAPAELADALEAALVGGLPDPLRRRGAAIANAWR